MVTLISYEAVVDLHATVARALTQLIFVEEVGSL